MTVADLKPITDATRLHDPSVDVTLADGQRHALLFGMDAAAYIEDCYDSLEEFAERLQGDTFEVSWLEDDVRRIQVVKGSEDAAKALQKEKLDLDDKATLKRTARANRPMTAIRDGMVAMLLHERPYRESIEERVAQIRPLLQFENILDYMKPVALALSKAMPKDGGPNLMGSGAGSPGNGSTGSPPSTSDEATSNSGA